MSKPKKQSRTLPEPAIRIEFGTLLAGQELLQAKLTRFSSFVGNPDYINEQSMALIMEVSEALRETPWKSWKKQQNLNMVKFREELADVQLFLLNLIISTGLSADDFLAICAAKQRLNFTRQDSGY